VSESKTNASGGGAAGERLGGRTIFALGWVSFFMDVSSEMIYPLLPVFLSSLGAGTVAIGFVAGLSEATASLFRVISGVISDRFRKRKSAILLGYGLSVLARPILALSAGWGQVLAFRLVDRAGKGIRTPPRDALITEASPPDRYGRSFGIQRAMDTAGAVVGPVLATAILASGLAYRSLFWLAMIPAAAAVATIQIFVREHARRPGAAAAAGPALTPHGEVPAGRSAGGAREGGDAARTPFSREMKLYLAVTAIFYLGNSSSFFLILRAKEIITEARSPWFTVSLIPILYLTMNLSSALLSYPAGKLADRAGKDRIAFLGYFLFAAAYAAFALAGSAAALWLLFPLQGVYLGFTEGVGTAYLATIVPKERRATGFALYHTVIGLALLPAGLLGGWLWSRFSPEATFLTGAVLALAAGCLFGALLLRRRPA
jgi:MFS family permease